jgi:hypothetical protein
MPVYGYFRAAVFGLAFMPGWRDPNIALFSPMSTRFTGFPRRCHGLAAGAQKKPRQGGPRRGV